MRYIIFLILMFFSLPLSVSAESLSSRLSGMIVLDVEQNGEAWYIYPVNKRRYYLGRPDDAFNIMRELGLGITNEDFEKLMDEDEALNKQLAGKIVIQVEENGEAWYIHPDTLKKYFLGRPADAFDIMREVGLGITHENLTYIGKKEYTNISKYNSYEARQVVINNEEFSLDIVEIDLANPGLEIITDTADSDDCKSNCQVKSLYEYIDENNAFAGMNGTYFCSYDSCEILNYYFFPVYNSNSGKMINAEELKYWTTGPIMAFDENNKFYYFKDSRDFPYRGWRTSNEKNVAEAFLETYGVKLQSAIGNKPRLIEEGKNLLIDFELDEKQKNIKSIRNAIGYKDNKIYLVIAKSATVPDLANIMKELGMEYALNMDGGYSAALFYDDEFIVGPGRDIPNVILFKETI